MTRNKTITGILLLFLSLGMLGSPSFAEMVGSLDDLGSHPAVISARPADVHAYF